MATTTQRTAPDPVSTNIREAREEAGLDQAELATLLCVTQGTVSHWEQGRALPSIPMLRRIAEHTNRTPAEFLA